MTKLLEQAIERLSELPEDMQDTAARSLLFDYPGVPLAGRAVANSDASRHRHPASIPDAKSNSSTNDSANTLYILHYPFNNLSFYNLIRHLSFKRSKSQ
jgi:hypothetical protein